MGHLLLACAVAALLQGFSGTDAASKKSSGNATIAGASEVLDPYSFHDSLEMNYTSTQERDALLQKVLSLFMKTLGAAIHVTGPIIKFGYDIPGARGSKEVSFGIDGRSPPLTVIQPGEKEPKSVVAQWHIALEKSPINGVAIPGYSPAGSSFNFTDTVVLGYGNLHQRDALMQNVSAVWKWILADYQTSNFTITVVSDNVSNQTLGDFGPAVMGRYKFINGQRIFVPSVTKNEFTGYPGHYVKYRVSGKSKVHPKLEDVLERFNLLLIEYPIAGVHQDSIVHYGTIGVIQ